VPRGDAHRFLGEEPDQHGAVVPQLVAEEDPRPVEREVVTRERAGQLRMLARSFTNGRDQRLAVDRDARRQHEACEVPEAARGGAVRGARDALRDRDGLQERRRPQRCHPPEDLEAVATEQDHRDAERRHAIAPEHACPGRSATSG